MFDGNCFGFHFHITKDEHVGDFLDFRVAHLLAEGFVGVVEFDADAGVSQ